MSDKKTLTFQTNFSLFFQRKLVIKAINHSKISGYDWMYVVNYQAIRLSFRNLVHSLPDVPGILVISGIDAQGQIKALKYLRCQESVRLSFGHSNFLSNFEWVMEQFTQKGYKEIRFQLAPAS